MAMAFCQRQFKASVGSDLTKASDNPLSGEEREDEAVPVGSLERGDQAVRLVPAESAGRPLDAKNSGGPKPDFLSFSDRDYFRLKNQA